MKKRFSILLLFMFVYSDIFAQLSTNEKPVSFSLKSKPVETSRLLAKVVMPELDMAKIEKEDKEDEELNMPPRFGYQHFVNYDLNNTGVWYKLPNGDKLWQLNVVCPNALSVNFCYDKFWIPEGGKFFIYSNDKKHVLGAFTAMNNKGDRNNLRGFATGLVSGSNVTLEYYQPKEVIDDAIISVCCVVHGYRYISIPTPNFGYSASCMVNINCEEGQKWQYEKNAVALMIINGAFYCTGSLITSTNNSGEPFFLTANHCISFIGDATNNTNLDTSFFYWNYETLGCSNSSEEPSLYSTEGATILANNIATDFALLRLSEDPKSLTDYVPFYLGWDKSGLSGNPGVCIHHPMGDVKKISTVKKKPTSLSLPELQYQYINTFWVSGWKQTINGHGMTQPGSSGAPFINEAHHVIGQLCGSNFKSCDSTNTFCWYGRFNFSWTGYGNDSICRRLNCWLDSINSNAQTMEGLVVFPMSKTITTNDSIYCNIKITSIGQLTIQSDIELMGNSRFIVEIIDGGTLSNADILLKPGASLKIRNGGIIKTRNGFEAPLGTTVEIINGQILQNSP